MQTLYPESAPRKVHRLRVSPLHELYLAEYGNPNGIPVLYCHGGPGAGSKPHHAQYFDPANFRVILFDQRGAGLSTPKSCLEENTTNELVADMEKIREHLGIERWVVGGGSWGSTLSLVYAQQFPERVLSLLLRGVFLARDEDCMDLLLDDSAAAKLRYPAWQAFKAKTAELLQKAKMDCSGMSLLNCYLALLRHTSGDLRREAASTFSRWEMTNAFLDDTRAEDIEWSMSDDGVNMGLTEITFLSERCYLQENQILANIHRIQHIPTHVIHGRYDLICLPKQADLLCAAVPKSVRYRPMAGHSGDEVETIDAMVTATQAIFAALS